MKKDRLLLSKFKFSLFFFCSFKELFLFNQQKRELCILLNPEDCYRMFSEIISNEKDSEFAISIVDILNTILLTSTELFDLRTSLKNFDTKV
jgi:vacuole morphology and inheritance protein 14